MVKFVDSHTHCEFSPDSRMKMADAVEKVRFEGLGGIAFTDHMDIDTPTKDRTFMFNPGEQQAAIDKLENEEEIEILKGIEIGLQPQVLDQIETLIGQSSFDQVIASVHFVDGVDPYHQPYYDGKDFIQAYGRYLDIIYECITSYRGFDILGHYDYIARYAPYTKKSLYYRDFPIQFDRILKFLASEGKALEINTNTYREKCGGVPKFDTDVLNRFRELGGEYVSLGSDAHDLNRIGEQFSHYSRIIKSCGFESITHFKGRKAKKIKID
ncbi:MAG: histidinol-phosphatase HisJ family protein [Rikenellaceae bacterium]|nr:histidinol-phosphatase HisJ family protein [Rikenellaceae bacterium]